jgi:outer membrane protein OmpA-like peptidoglycan-associated protein
MLLSRLVIVSAAGLLWACAQSPGAAEDPQTNAAEDADFTRMATAGRMLPDLRQFLADSEKAPRTFAFDRLIFERGSWQIRAVDEQTLLALAHTLKTHPRVRVRVVGYDDGSRALVSGRPLGLKRAEAVVAYLNGTGVRSGVVQAAAGRAAARLRPTELVVLKK